MDLRLRESTYPALIEVRKAAFYIMAHRTFLARGNQYPCAFCGPLRQSVPFPKVCCLFFETFIP